MYKWLWSKLYNGIMKDAENKCLRDWRKNLLNNISGDVLELGCGTGANLEFYPDSVKRLVLVEPNIHMHKHLEEKILTYKLNRTEILNDVAENLSIRDASFDVVICTLVLCSVKNLEKALLEIHRILKPTGRLIFIEHIAAVNNLKRYQWQCRLEFLWKRIADGCHVTRHTEEAIINAGFEIVELTRQSLRGVPPIARPSIKGIAQKL